VSKAAATRSTQIGLCVNVKARWTACDKKRCTYWLWL
jgi:hypothetical protein